MSIPLFHAPHRTMFFTGMATLAVGSLWWAVEILGRGMMMHLAVRVGLWGVLVPVFYTVCHRMLPFFADWWLGRAAIHALGMGSWPASSSRWSRASRSVTRVERS